MEERLNDCRQKFPQSWIEVRRIIGWDGEDIYD